MLILFNYILKNGDDGRFYICFYHNKKKKLWKTNKQHTYTHTQTNKKTSTFLCCVIAVQQICSCAYCIPYPVQVQNFGSVFCLPLWKYSVPMKSFISWNRVKSIPGFPKVRFTTLLLWKTYINSYSNGSFRKTKNSLRITFGTDVSLSWKQSSLRKTFEKQGISVFIWKSILGSWECGSIIKFRNVAT